MRLLAKAWSAPWLDGVAILIHGTGYDDERLVGVSVAMAKAPAEGEACKETLIMDKSAVQSLMDDLRNAGFKPSEISTSAGSLASTQKHLEDMRTLVFKHHVLPKP